MQPILFATDFSPESQKALEFAIALADAHKAELIVLHVYQDDTLFDFAREKIDGSYTKSPEEIANILLRDFVKSQQSKLSKLHVDFVALNENSVSRGILQVVTDIKPAILVIGADESNRSKELISGSTVMSLIRKSVVPVMAIPEHLVFSKLSKVIYATDFFEKDIVALKRLIDLLKPFDPMVKVVHICQEKDHEEAIDKLNWYKEIVSEQIDGTSLGFQQIVSEDIYLALNTIIIEDEYDTLVMMEKERTGLIDELFHQDLVNQMEFDLPIPLICFHEKDL